MTQEQKAKAYDEAKYIMKEYIESGNAGVIAEKTIKRAFPELEESEDDKIRKELIIYLRSILSIKKYGDKFIEDWIAWLEAKGKQKLVDKIEPKFKVKYADNEYNVLYVKDIAGVTFYGIEDEPNHIDYVLPDNCEIISEQKPTWSEEDTQYINDTLALLSFGCSIHSVGEVQEWLQSLNNRVQLKQEWSEEDKEMLDDIIVDVEVLKTQDKTKTGKAAYQREIDWLKSLKPQNNITDKELINARNEAYNDALDKIEYNSDEPTFNDGWSAAIWYLKKRNVLH